MKQRILIVYWHTKNEWEVNKTRKAPIRSFTIIKPFTAPRASRPN
nr:hypothetical protein [Snodgrassella alvi]